jgi:putative proteasome-type protease
MTYCVGIRLESGLVFLSDSRTNAGVDNFSTARKMTVFERDGERLLTVMSAGNLAVSQAVKQWLCEPPSGQADTLWTVGSMADAARIVGDAVRAVHARDAQALKEHGVEFNVTLILGGQIGNERPRLFCVYAAGNFIEAHSENCYFQIGESKYGKPILDRVVTPQTSLDEAAKCALISMDSTLKSNLSVGLPLDLLVYERDRLRITRFARIDENNLYFGMIRKSWGRRLRQIFAEIDDPSWEAASDDVMQEGRLPIASEDQTAPVLVRPPAARPSSVHPAAHAPGSIPTERGTPRQTLAGTPGSSASASITPKP